MELKHSKVRFLRSSWLLFASQVASGCNLLLRKILQLAHHLTHVLKFGTWAQKNLQVSLGDMFPQLAIWPHILKCGWNYWSLEGNSNYSTATKPNQSFNLAEAGLIKFCSSIPHHPHMWRRGCKIWHFVAHWWKYHYQINCRINLSINSA